MNGVLKNKNIYALVFFIILAICYSWVMLSKYWGKPGVDFPSFYYAVKLVFSENLTPYSVENWELARNMYNPSLDLWPFLYLPPTLFLFWPLNFFDILSGSNLLLILNLGLVILFGYLFLFRTLSSKVALLLLLGGIYLFFFYPLERTLDTGQINLFVLIALCLMWLGLQKRWHPGFVGFSFVVAVLLKLYPAIFLLYLIIKKEKRVILWSLSILLVLVLMSFVFLPDGIWTDWYETIAEHGYGERIAEKLNPSSAANQSLNGLWSRFFLGKGKVIDNIGQKFLKPWQAETANRFMIYGSILVLTSITFIVIWYKSFQFSERNIPWLNLEFSILLLLQFVISPFSWGHHLVIVLPALIIGGKLCLEKDTSWIKRILILLCLIILAIFFDYNNEKLFTGWATLMISIKLFAVLILWTIFTLTLWQRKRQTSLAA